jgi:hypothetical protein
MMVWVIAATANNLWVNLPMLKVSLRVGVVIDLGLLPI